MTLEEQQVFQATKQARLLANNSRQAFTGANKRKRRIAGRIKELYTDLKHQEANLRLLEEQLPVLEQQFLDAEKSLRPLERKYKRLFGRIEQKGESR
jgi:hypothetical protein